MSEIGSVSIRKPTIYGISGGYGGFVIRKPTISGKSSSVGGVFIHTPSISATESTLDTTGYGATVLPSPNIEATSEWTVGVASVDIPSPIIAGSSLRTNGFGYVSVHAPSISALGISTSGQGAISISRPRIAAFGSNGTFGTGKVKIKVPGIVASELISNTLGTVIAIVPTPFITATELHNAIVCLVMGLDAGMPLSEYTNYDFTGFAKLGETYLALSKDGNIYRLGGDTDITESIDAIVETGQDPCGSMQSKRLLSAVVGISSNGSMQYRAHRYDGYGEYIGFETTENSVMETRKLPTEKLHLSRTIGIELSNVDGADFTVDSLELDVRISPRRSGGS